MLDRSEFRERTAARAVVLDEHNNISLLFVAKHNFHKLPGGGVEGDEETAAALFREVIEETGFEIKIEREIGKILEYRNEHKLKQWSLCWIARITGRGTQQFTQEETDDGFELQTATLAQAIDLVQNDKPTNYDGKFVQARDLVFLQTANELLS